MVNVRATLRRGVMIGLAIGATGILGACDLILAIGHGDRFVDPNVSCAGDECVCVGGFGDCDYDVDTGCETALDADPINCGACGNICANGACLAGSCACDPGFVDCDGDPANGCEAFPEQDLNNCGACGHDCAGGLCQAGVCQPVTLSGLDFAFSLAVEGDRIYVARCGDPAVAVSSVLGGAVEPAVSVSEPQGCAEIVFAADQALFYAQAGAILSAKIDAWGPYPPTTISSPSAAGSPTRFLRATASHVYWWSHDAATSSSEIVRASLAGSDQTTTSAGAVTALTTDASGVFYSDETGLHFWGGGVADIDPSVQAASLAIDGFELVYADAEGIFTMPPSGGAKTLLHASSSVKAIAVDASHVFFVEGSEVRRVPRQGTGVTKLSAGEAFGPYPALVVDADAVYWITADQRVRKVAK